jgi:uncharacterized protein YraI
MKRIVMVFLCWLCLATVYPIPASAADSNLYRVAFVADNDFLSVRSGPGVEYAEVGQLPYNASDVVYTGTLQSASDGGLWVTIQWNAITGWVNRYFLTQQVETTIFCSDLAAYKLIVNFVSAVQNHDGAALSTLTGPLRGILLRRHTWNPEVELLPAEVSGLFTDPTVRVWGIGAGSGNPITGSTTQVIVPLLDADLIGGQQIACDQILAGGTTSLVVLPIEYRQVHFFGIYRPAPNDDHALEWGSWAIGVEYWDGKPVIAFAVHYEWEI